MFLDPLAEFAQRGEAANLAFIAITVGSITAGDFCFTGFANGCLDEVPLIYDDDAGASFFDNFIGDLFILFVDPFLGVKDEDADIGAGNGFLGAFDAKKFDGIIHATGFAEPRGIDENVGLADAIGFNFKRNIDGIAGSASDRCNDDAIGLCKSVDDGGFADIRSADDGDLKRTFWFGDFRFWLDFGGEFFRDGFWCNRGFRWRKQGGGGASSDRRCLRHGWR